MKVRVSEAVLRGYYELWLSGVPASQIRTKLKLSVKKFNEYTPDFLAYCRHQVKFDTRVQLSDGDEPNLVKLTKEREEEFLFHLGTGLTYHEAATIMDIPLVTVTDYWFKVPGFKAKVDLAVKLVNAKAKQAFYRRVIGYSYDGGHRTITTGTKIIEGFEGEGEDRMKIVREIPYSSETVIEKINVVEPDVNAGKFWLYNRVPDEFSIDGQRTNANNKGKIMQWIDENVNNIVEDDLEVFDKAQKEYDDKYLK